MEGLRELQHILRLSSSTDGKIVGDTVVGADSKEGWLKTIEKELEGLK